VKVALIKPGPTDTAMTAEYKAKGIKMARPIDVAMRIIYGVGRVNLKYMLPVCGNGLC